MLTVKSAALERMLNLNQDKLEDGDSSNLDDSRPQDVWKVLIFDSVGRDVISSVLRVDDLFKNGITVHMLLNSERYPIPDVPAIYFVAPTSENIKIISRDLSKGLYEASHVNFTSPLPRELLEEFAQETVQCSASVRQVFDQYLNFVVSEPNMYSLGLENIYSKLADPKVQESDIERIISQIVDGLFSVVLTQGSIPIIRSSRGNAAEMVAQKLDEKLRNHVLNSRNPAYAPPGNSVAVSAGIAGGPTSSLNRPVLVVVDRNIDLVSMLSHSWTYQCLINDALELNKNRISVVSKEADGRTTKKSYDLDPHDFFWAKNAGLPFPEVADNLDSELSKYKADAQELTGRTGITDVEDLESVDLSSNAQHLKAALTALPELTERKRTIDMHMNIATTLLKDIEARGLAQFFEAEENAGRQTKTIILEHINNVEWKNPEDKLRMFLVLYMVSDNLSAGDLAEYEAALTAQGCDLRPLNYIKRVKEITKMSILSPPTSVQTQGSDLFKGFSGITNKLADRLKDGKLTEGFGNIISNFRNLLPTSKDLSITKVVESIMDPTIGAASATDDYLYFDPRATRGALTRPPIKNSYDEAIVFMVGGGNYLEYGNVQDWITRNGSVRRVVYGSTDICSPSKFLNEIAILGEQ